MASKNEKFKWTIIEQKAFEKIKRKVTCNTLWTYSGFSKEVDIHTNNINLQSV